MSEIGKEYMGDSVYAEFTGHDIILTTENGMIDDPSNTIHMDQEVFTCLIKYADRVKAHNRKINLKGNGNV